MSGLPQITIVGTLTGDPELRALPSGAMVATVNIAANDRRYNKETSRWEDGDTTFLRGSIWKAYAENVADSLRKGDKVIAVGTLHQRSWEKDGQKRTAFELHIDEIGPTLRFTKVTSSSASNGAPVTAGWGASDEPAW